MARPLGLDVVDAARAVHDIVNANMAAAIRVVTVQRGIDPRTFVMVAFGGAGPMHACRIADEFGIGRLVVPWGAGVASAIGLAHADPGAEWRRPFASDLDALDATELARGFEDLEQRAREEIGPDGDDATFVVERFVGMRVRGQVHALEIPVTARDGAVVDALRAGFVEHYGAAYGVAPASRLQLTSAQRPRRPSRGRPPRRRRRRRARPGGHDSRR